jgi:cyclase
VKDKGLVKSTQFKNYRYLGDPTNAVRIYNEKEVDELILLDIDATAQNRIPDLKMIKHIAEECRMPLCYGGGVKTVEQAQDIFSLGVEKISLSASAIENPELITKIAHKVGSQSVVVVLDVKKKLFGGYEVYINNGKTPVNKNPFDLITKYQELGAGEIVINNIDNDGMMKGYDLALMEKARAASTLPLTGLGGVGSLGDIEALIKKFGIIGAAAGSLFVYKGKLRGVLINYPSPTEKDDLIKKSIL